MKTIEKFETYFLYSASTQLLKLLFDSVLQLLWVTKPFKVCTGGSENICVWNKMKTIENREHVAVLHNILHGF